MLRSWVNILPFGFVVWYARRHCERIQHVGLVVPATCGVLINIPYQMKDDTN